MVDIIIGDEHGTGKFLNIYNKNKGRKDIRYFVCCGDYFDPYSKISFEEMKNNFNGIVKAAREDSRIVLLLGNHDMNYINKIESSRCDKYNRLLYKELFENNIDLFRLYIKLNDSTIVSHAGFSKCWYDAVELEDVNDIITKKEYQYLQYYYRDYSGYGDNPHQSCVWIRPGALLESQWPDGITTQIVGHTKIESLAYFNPFIKCVGNTPT